MTPRVPMLDAALEGFRLTRERPAAVGVWAALILAINLATLGGLTALGLGAPLARMTPFAPASPADVAALSEAGVWLPMLALLQVGGNAVLYAAVMRAVTEPRASRFAFLRLGAQELRQVVLWGVGAVLLFAYATLLLAAFQLVALADPPGGKLMATAAAAAVFLALFYPLVRLSLAPAATFAERRIVLFGAWGLSKGEFWSLVGCYVTALLLAAAVWLLATVVVGTLVAVASLVTPAGPELERRFEQVDLSSLAAFFSPVALGSLAVQAALGALLLAILAAPAPIIYLALSGRPAPER